MVRTGRSPFCAEVTRVFAGTLALLLALPLRLHPAAAMRQY